MCNAAQKRRTDGRVSPIRLSLLLAIAQTRSIYWR
jgi:hypothetical protein